MIQGTHQFLVALQIEYLQHLDFYKHLRKWGNITREVRAIQIEVYYLTSGLHAFHTFAIAIHPLGQRHVFLPAGRHEGFLYVGAQRGKDSLFGLHFDRTLATLNTIH